MAAGPRRPAAHPWLEYATTAVTTVYRDYSPRMDTVPLPIIPPQPPQPTTPPRRRRRTGLIIGAVVGGLAVLLCTCGIGGVLAFTLHGGESEEKRPVASPVEPVAPAPSSAPPSPSSTVSPSVSASPAPKATIPNVAGKRLSDAYAQLQGLGFTTVGASDATGEGRLVLNYSNWVVRSQLPAPGSTVPVTDQLTLNVSKPSDGQPVDPVTVGVVPKVVCRDLAAAKDILRAAGFTKISSEDGTDDDRTQIVDRNWLVTAQSAKPGSRPDPDGRITLTVVKYGEPTGRSGCKS